MRGFLQRVVVVLGETVLRVDDLDGLGPATSAFDGADLEDTVGVDLEADFNLMNTRRSRWDAVEVEFAV